MKESIEKIILEKAKDGNKTCKVKVSGKWRYLYSKYKPYHSVNFPELPQHSYLILLGLGMGYELLEAIDKTDKPIYVIENQPLFYDILKKSEGFSALLNHPQVNFLFGEEYKKLEGKIEAPAFIETQVSSFDWSYFSQVIHSLSHSSISSSLPERFSSKEKILFFEHPTVANDAIESLRKLGYQVTKFPLDPLPKLAMQIAEEAPDYLITINANEKVAKISKLLKIPYLVWSVDTPDYPLHSQLMLDDQIFLFVYDLKCVNNLKEKGYKNIFHLPVAANVDRLSQIIPSSEERLKYAAEVSFIGSTGKQNEYNDYSLEEKLNEDFKESICQLFLEQSRRSSSSSFYEQITPKMVNNFKESGFQLSAKDFMSPEENLSYFFGKKYNEIERTELVTILSNRFRVKVYGDEMWKSYANSQLTYMGYAEHYKEMPTVFKVSSININLTRIYVQSGLPMRIFDVLGSQGFLVTNDKEELHQFFSPGEDFVIFRDLQDLSEIIEYYLPQKKKREAIALRGYEKIKREHTFDIRLSTMMSQVKKMLAKSS